MWIRTATLTIFRSLELEKSRESIGVPSIRMTDKMSSETNPSIPLAHDVEKKERTDDVKLTGLDAQLEFRDLQISPLVVQGLIACGFKRPSPVQLEAIPLGKCGYDLVIQSKSGTGKTCVFTVLALEEVDVTKRCVQVVILNPVRELAIQNADVAAEIGCCIPGLKIQTFIGGTPLSANVLTASDCHIAVGTPGRMVQLVRELTLDLSQATLLILDEADKLTDSKFFPDVQFIMDAMPGKRQIIAASATYPANLDEFIGVIMKAPKEVKIDPETPALIGVHQVIFDVPKVMELQKRLDRDDDIKARFRCLLKIIECVNFTQAMVFCQFQLRASEVYRDLAKLGYDVKLLSARLAQKDRTESFQNFRRGIKKLIVCTDLCARGLDSETLDLVINFELPYDLPTYVHRVGRAGRFGSIGTTINLIANARDEARILSFQKDLTVDMFLIDSPQSLAQVRESLDSLSKHLRRLSPPSAVTVVENMGISPEYFDFCVFGSEEAKAASEIERLTHYAPMAKSNEELEEEASRKLGDVNDLLSTILDKLKRRKLRRESPDDEDSSSSSDSEYALSDISALSGLESD